MIYNVFIIVLIYIADAIDAFGTSSASSNNLFGTSPYGTESTDMSDLQFGDVVSCDIETFNVPLFKHYMIILFEGDLFEYGTTNADRDMLITVSLFKLLDAFGEVYIPLKLIKKITPLDKISFIGSVSSVKNSSNSLVSTTTILKKKKNCVRYRNPILDNFTKNAHRYESSVQNKALSRIASWMNALIERSELVMSYTKDPPLRYDESTCNCQTIVDYVLMHYTVPGSRCMRTHLNSRMHDYSQEVLKTRFVDRSFYYAMIREFDKNLFNPYYVEYLDNPKYMSFDSDVLTAFQVNKLLVFSRLF